MNISLVQASLRSSGLAALLVALFLVDSSLFAAPLAAAASVDAGRLPPPAGRKIDFAKNIQPILDDNCYECHGAKKQEHDLRLDQRTTALKGGESGPALVAGKSAESLLIHAVAGLKVDLARMPKKRDALTAEKIGLLRAWIDQGAVWPDNVPAETKDPKDHWAFKAPVRPNLPEPKNKKWI